MVDLLESREASQKIEAPQFSVDDRELPNYWILLKFYAAFRLKAQQTNCKYGSACILHSVVNVGSNTPIAPQLQTTILQRKFTNPTARTQIY